MSDVALELTLNSALRRNTWTRCPRPFVSSDKIEAFRSVFESSLSDIAAETGGPSDPKAIQERCIILSGGVDRCAVLAAARKLGIKFGGALTVVTSDESPDLGFSAACAAEH